MPRCSALLVAAMLFCVGCRFDEKTVAPGREQVVVHAILDPGRVAHRVLLESVLTGRTALPAEAPFDSLDPVNSRGGVAVSGALVVIRSNTGDSAVATERVAPTDQRGTGMYEFLNRADAATDGPVSRSVEVVRGRRYELRVVTADGQLLTASTTVPDAPTASRSGSLEPFNRDRETRFLFWNPVPGAERYAISASSPWGRYFQFVDSVEFEVSGALQHTTEKDAGHVFVPGFSQELSVVAVDRNYFDYFRSHNDAVTGRGLLSHVTGGLGVFASVVLLRFSRLAVTADVDHPLEGIYERVAGTGPAAIRLFVTSTDAAETGLSGTHSTTGEPAGVLGTLRGDSVRLALLRGQSARDTAAVIDGLLTGHELRGRLRGSAMEVVYRRTDASTGMRQ